MEGLTKKIKLSGKNDPTKIKEQRRDQEINNKFSYDTLRLIFAYLGARDIHNSAKVCRVWREAAENEINIRGPEYFVKYFRQSGKQETANTSEASLIGNQIRIRPSLGLFYVKIDEAGDWKPEGCFCTNLPSKCSSIILGGYDLVANGEKVDNVVGTALCSLIPKIPKLKIDLFDVGEHTFKAACDMDYDEHVKQILNKLLPSKNEKSKCIIMLANHNGYSFMKKMLTEIGRCYKPGTISLWGGVCVDLKVCNTIGSLQNCMQSKYWVGIGLSSPQMQSWSVVMRQSCRSQTHIEERLQTLKNSITLKRQSMGFMFACCARIDQKEIETAAFKKVFPKVPIVGLHGDGEYGLNTLSTGRESSMHHQYSTIFMILTYD